MTFLQFVGDPKGHNGPYTFYNGFKFFKHGKYKVILLGQFFFVRISAQDDPCIGELLMLWDDRHSNQRLSSVRLYFLPEQTPEGRLSYHGEHEVLAASDRVVLKVDDLIGWITDQVDWNHGIVSACTDDVDPPSEDVVASPSSAVEEEKEAAEESDAPKDTKDTEDVTKEKDSNESALASVGSTQSDGVPPAYSENSCGDDKDELAVLVLPYPKYCRFRAMMKRLEGVENKWLRNPIIVALGGFALPGRKMHILYCRDTFDHEELAQHDMNCEYLAPTVKKKRRRRKAKNVRSISPDSESITSEESKDTSYKGGLKEVKNGLKKQIPCKTEQEFLQKLFKFMKERNTPIQRVPHLGFKQIDLFLFFTFAQKLGGYNKITGKKLWKHVYDELGGDPGSTSAATCTRKHYERLLLPFERFMEGKECEITADPTKPRSKKVSKDGNEPCDTKEASHNGATEVEDAYTFTDSNQENSNSKDSNIIEDVNSGGEQNSVKSEDLSALDSKTVWSIQKKPDAKDEVDVKDDCKQVKPLIIQKGQNETFSEKERKWNEIRRKNALARKRVRQLRPSRGFKIPSAKMLPETISLNQGQELPPLKVELDSKENEAAESDLKTSVEASEESPSLNQTAVVTNISRRKSRSSLDHSKGLAVPVKPDVSRYLQEKINSTPQLLDNSAISAANGIPLTPSPQAPILVDKNIKLHPPYMKPESSKVDVKSWYGYSKDSLPYQKLPPTKINHVGVNFFPMSNSIKEESKPTSHLMSDPTCDMVKTPEQNPVHSAVFPPAVKMEVSNNEEAANVSQRRPSVIQHTEFITSPSASQSPKLLGVETSPEAALKDGPQLLPPFIVNGQKIDVISNHLSQTMAGKVAEWLTKGVPPDAASAKTPPTLPVKAAECHDKVLTPSRTPGIETSKAAHMCHNSKSRNQSYIPSANRTVHDKYSLHSYRKGLNPLYRPLPPCFSVNSIRNNALSQQTFPPGPSTSFTGTFSDRSSKYPQTLGAPIRNPVNVSGPFFNHPKRHKASPVSLPSPMSVRPSLLPSSHQQMYRTSPLCDVPKTTASPYSGYENSVLDLSIKKRSPNIHCTTTAAASMSTGVKVQSGDDGVCLDLSIKKKPSSTFTSNNGIENITPPLPASPSPVISQASSFPVTSALKPLPTLLSLRDLMEEAAAHQNSCLSSRKTNSHVGQAHHTSSPVPPHLMPTSSMSLPASTHGTVHHGLISPLPHSLYTKDIGKSMYLPKEHHSQFLPYVIPPYYSQNWTSSVSSSVNSSSYSKTSPNISKGTAAHNVFPKHHPYNYNPQLYPSLCKDNVQHPSNTK